MSTAIDSRRFRVPDVCVYSGPGPSDAVFRQPPFLCVEILSPEDRMSRVEDTLADYFARGVEQVWIVDPERRAAAVHTAAGSGNVRAGIRRTASPEIAITLDQIPPGL